MKIQKYTETHDSNQYKPQKIKHLNKMTLTTQVSRACFLACMEPNARTWHPCF